MHAQSISGRAGQPVPSVAGRWSAELPMPKFATSLAWLRRSGQPGSRSWAGVRPEVGVVAIVAVALLAVLAVAVFTRGDSFDRGAAVARVVDTGGGRITQSQAECYVDRVHAEVGARYLEAGARPPADVAARLTSIRVDCVGVANLGVPSATALTSDTGVPSTESGNLPRRFGDDPVLDALVTQCGAGVGQACDDLFDRAPIGSEYESFALTCGGRTTEAKCASVYTVPPG
jgi:hypothetical protein